MKFNEKFQFGGRVGGGQYSVPVPVGPTRVDTSGYAVRPANIFKPSLKADRSGLAIDKDALKNIKGLTSDVNVLMDEVHAWENAVNSLTDLDILAGTDKYKMTMQGINRALGPERINEIRINEESYNKSKELLKKNRGEKAFATDANGFIVAINNKTGKHEYITPAQYADSKDMYSPLTGNAVSDGRRDKKGLAYDNRLMGTLNTTTGGLKIAQDVNDQLKSLGENAYEKHIIGVNAVASIQPNLRGFEEWKNKVGNNKKQIDSMDYIWNIMPESDRSQMRMLAIRDLGADASNIEDKARFLTLKMLDKARKKSEVTKLREYEPEETKGRGRGGGSTSTVTLGPMVSSMLEGQKHKYDLAPKGSDVKMEVWAARPAYTDRGKFVNDNNTASRHFNLEKAVGPDGRVYTQAEKDRSRITSSYHIMFLPKDSKGRPDMAKMKSFNKAIGEQQTRTGKPLTKEEMSALSKKMYGTSNIGAVVGFSIQSIDESATPFWKAPWDESPSKSRLYHTEDEYESQIYKEEYTKKYGDPPESWFSKDPQVFSSMMYVPVDETQLDIIDKSIAPYSAATVSPKSSWLLSNEPKRRVNYDTFED